MKKVTILGLRYLQANMFVYLFLATLSSSLLSLVGKNIASGKLCLNTPTLLMVNSQGKKKDFSCSFPKRKAVVKSLKTILSMISLQQHPW